MDFMQPHRDLYSVSGDKLRKVVTFTSSCAFNGGWTRTDIRITMKIPVTSINNIYALLAEVVGTDNFDLLLYHYPFSMFDSKAQLKQSWIHMTELPKA
jgi:hypothetical protein